MKPNFPSHIIVQWDHEIETLDQSTLGVHGHHHNATTSAFWPETGQRVQYKASCDTEWKRDGTRILTLEYLRKDNAHLSSVQDIVWGRSRVTLRPDSKSGFAEWRTEDSNRWLRRKWESAESFLLSTRSRSSVLRYERRQATLRKDLLTYEKVCSVSGESLQLALEAAHIIGVASGGADKVFNMTLLRADIHKLFDGQYFTIKVDGTIKVLKPLTPQYAKLIKSGSKIPVKTFARIKDALRLRGDA